MGSRTSRDCIELIFRGTRERPTHGKKGGLSSGEGKTSFILKREGTRSDREGARETSHPEVQRSVSKEGKRKRHCSEECIRTGNWEGGNSEMKGVGKASRLLLIAYENLGNTGQL